MVASEQAVSSMLPAAFARHELTSLIPREVIDYFEGMETLNGLRNREIRGQLLEVAAALNRVGVTPVFLKGAGNLISGLYDRPSHRVMIDIDVLVPLDLLFDCVEALKESGYRDRDDGTVADPRSHHYPAMHKSGGVAEVELHCDVLGYPHGDLLSAEDVFRDALHMEADDARFAVPSTEHRVIHTIAHSQVVDQNYLHGFIMIRQLIECLQLERISDPALDHTALQARFAAAGASLPFACQALALNRCFDANWPDAGSSGWAARFFHGYALAQINWPRTASFLSRMIRPMSLLKRSVFDQRLRARLRQNLFKPAWLRRQWRSLLGK